LIFKKYETKTYNSINTNENNEAILNIIQYCYNAGLDTTGNVIYDFIHFLSVDHSQKRFLLERCSQYMPYQKSDVERIISEEQRNFKNTECMKQSIIDLLNKVETFQII